MIITPFKELLFFLSLVRHIFFNYSIMKITLILVLCCAINQINAQVTPGSVVEENIEMFLSTPANKHVKEIPIVIIRYLPTTDGINLDVSQATDYWSPGEMTLNQLKANIGKFDQRAKFMLEEGSKFHGYKSADAIPYLGYKVIKYLTVYRQIQISDFQIGTEGGKNLYQPDYKKEFDDLELTNFINNHQVKEVWLWYGEAARPGWPSYSSSIHGNIQKFVTFVESNMSSPATGDISNSHRIHNDLPILNHTYVVYSYNFRRSQAEAVHNHGHQLESIYKYAATAQDGNFNLFVSNFSGWGTNYSTPPIGRAGDCHHPPNTTTDYDYLNPTAVESDIEDWKPNGGITKPVNVDTWGNLKYNWPGETDFSQRKESQWYIYWMQNMPGYNNSITFGKNIMTNWWQLTENWDEFYKLGLYTTNTGIQNNLNGLITIYPNPATDLLTFTFKDASQPALVELFDTQGKLLVSKEMYHNQQLPVSQLQSGMYFCKIIQNGLQYTSKLLIK